MGCRGICTRYKAKKEFMKGRYASGQKRCSQCEIFMNWDDGNNCPCCGASLRGISRNTKRANAGMVKQQASN